MTRSYRPGVGGVGLAVLLPAAGTLKAVALSVIRCRFPSTATPLAVAPDSRPAWKK